MKRYLFVLSFVLALSALGLIGCGGGGGGSAPTLSLVPYYAGSSGTQYIDSLATMQVAPTGDCSGFTSDVTLGSGSAVSDYTFTPPCNTVGAIVTRSTTTNCSAHTTGLSGWLYEADEYTTPSPAIYNFWCGIPSHQFVIAPTAAYQSSNTDLIMTAPTGTFNESGGMPSVFFYDDEGNYAGETSSADVGTDGTWTLFYSGAFDSGSIGTYAAVVFNPTNDTTSLPDGVGLVNLLANSGGGGGGGGDPGCGDDCNPVV